MLILGTVRQYVKVYVKFLKVFVHIVSITMKYQIQLIAEVYWV